MPYRPLPIRRESVTSKAAEEICRYIEAERLGPGQRLPSELQLAGMLGISRNSLREALRILDGLGFVEKRPDTGIVVKGPGLPPASAPGRQAILDAIPATVQMRAIIEIRCAELAAAAATDENLAELESHVSRFEEALKRGDLVAATQAHGTFHDTLVAAAHNPSLAGIFQQVRFVIAEIGPLVLRRTAWRRVQREIHREILDAVARRDGRRAAAAVKKHFRDVGALVEFNVRHRRGPGDGGRPQSGARA